MFLFRHRCEAIRFKLNKRIADQPKEGCQAQRNLASIFNVVMRHRKKKCQRWAKKNYVSKHDVSKHNFLIKIVR